MELRIGYYLWLAGLMVWAIGVGCLLLLGLGKPTSSAKVKNGLDDFEFRDARPVGG